MEEKQKERERVPQRVKEEKGYLCPGNEKWKRECFLSNFFSQSKAHPNLLKMSMSSSCLS